MGQFSEQYKLSGDVDWFSRADDMGMKMFVLDEVFLRKRIHGQNLTFDAKLNSSELLAVLRDSIVRRRSTPPRPYNLYM